MDKSAFAQQHEPAITGVLVGEMRSFLESGADTYVSHHSIRDASALEIHHVLLRFV